MLYLIHFKKPSIKLIIATKENLYTVIVVHLIKNCVCQCNFNAVLIKHFIEQKPPLF